MTTQPYSFDTQADYGVDLEHVPAAAGTYRPDAGDLVVDATGDFVAIGGPMVVVQDRVKELLTPYGSLGRYVRDVDGLKYVDGTYGNPAYLLLSEPLNTLPLQLIADSCENIMLKDERVEQAKAFPDILPDTGMILVRIDYVLVAGFAGSLSLRLVQPSTQS
jgi:hypothetical protein